MAELSDVESFASKRVDSWGGVRFLALLHVRVYLLSLLLLFDLFLPLFPATT